MTARHCWKAIIGLGAALIVLSSAPTEVAAECTQVDRWPSFRTIAPSAKVIVVGEVLANPEDTAGYVTTGFRLRVDEVLRGRSEAVLEFREAVTSGLPLTICPGDSVLYVRHGDRLAMAFGGRYPEVDGPVTSIAFLDGEPDSFLLPGIERLTLDEVRSVAGLPPTDTRPAGEGRAESPAVALLLVGLIGGWVAVRHLGKRAR